MFAGSKAEGTSKGTESDFDILMAFGEVKATENNIDATAIETDLTFFMEQRTAPPGYCKLLLIQPGRNNHWHREFDQHYCYVKYPEYNRALLSSTFVVHMLQKHVHPPGLSKIAGPSNQGQFPGSQDRDNVSAIRCSQNISVFNKLFTRHYQLGRPTRQILEQIRQAEVFVVPVGKHGSKYQHMEWRLSFNVAEKILIHNFTTVQFKVYILMKMVIKEIVQLMCNVSITSYIVKTLMLWAVEQIPTEDWREGRLVELLFLMLKRLNRCVQTRFCSMYFIPECNILHGRVTKENQQSICDALSSLLSERKSCICKLTNVQAKLTLYMSGQCIYISPALRLSCGNRMDTLDLTLLHLRHIHTHSQAMTQGSQILCCLRGATDIPYRDLLFDILSTTTPDGSTKRKLARFTFSRVLSQFALQQCVNVSTKGGRNGHNYSSIRKSIKLLKSSCHTNVLCGRVKLGLVLLMLGRHELALDVLNSGSERIRYYMQRDATRVGLKIPVVYPKFGIVVASEGLSMVQILKHFSIQDMDFDHKMKPCLPKAVQYEFHRSCDRIRPDVTIDSETLLYYLQYLCYTELGQRKQAHKTFETFVKLAVKISSNIEYREVALNILGKCLREVGYDEAIRVLVKSVMLFKKCPHRLDMRQNAALWQIAFILNNLYSTR